MTRLGDQGCAQRLVPAREDRTTPVTVVHHRRLATTDLVPAPVANLTAHASLASLPFVGVSSTARLTAPLKRTPLLASWPAVAPTPECDASAAAAAYQGVAAAWLCGVVLGLVDDVESVAVSSWCSSGVHLADPVRRPGAASLTRTSAEGAVGGQDEGVSPERSELRSSRLDAHGRPELLPSWSTRSLEGPGQALIRRRRALARLATNAQERMKSWVCCGRGMLLV